MSTTKKEHGGDILDRLSARDQLVVLFAGVALVGTADNARISVADPSRSVVGDSDTVACAFAIDEYMADRVIELAGPAEAKET